MASASKRHGYVKSLERWKHLRWRKRQQNRLVRIDGRRQIQQAVREQSNG